MFDPNFCTHELRILLPEHLIDRLKATAKRDGVALEDLVTSALDSRVPPLIDPETGQRFIFFERWAAVE